MIIDICCNSGRTPQEPCANSFLDPKSSLHANCYSFVCVILPVTTLYHIAL